MSVSPYSASRFVRSATCLPCCPQPEPTECQCALLIPPFASPYADYATAEAAIADQVSNCIGYSASAVGLDSFSAVYSGGDTVDVDAAVTLVSQAVGIFYISVAVNAGDTLTIAYNVSSSVSPGGGDDNNSVQVDVTECNTTTVVYTDTDSSGGTGAVSGSFVFGPFAASGSYTVVVSGAGQNVDDPDEETTMTLDSTVSSDAVMPVNPVIALWDDSGTTRELEACPKMLLPVLTESTGDWYADCAEAADAFTDHTTDCFGYYDGAVDATTAGFSSTDGGTSLGFEVATMDQPMTCYGSVNVEGGETITITTAGGGEMTGVIYDQDGALVESFTSEASPWTSAALPHSGRYTIYLADVSNPPPTPTTWPITATVTSSGTLSVNPAQALYDGGLGCPSCLNCGDACP